MLQKLSPNLMVKDIRETIDFYKNILGFEFVMAVPESQDNIFMTLDDSNKNIALVYAMMKNWDIEIMFQEEKSLKEDVSYLKNASNIWATCTFYYSIKWLEEKYEEIKNKVKIIKDIWKTWYWVWEFYFLDNNGYIICLSEEKES